MKVYVKTPARLQLGLIDLNGDLGRLFGGLGVGIDRPNVVLEAQPSEKLTVAGERNERTKALAKRFFETYGVKTRASINVKQAIPEHSGLGSGHIQTRTCLSRSHSTLQTLQFQRLNSSARRSHGTRTANKRRHHNLRARRIRS